MKIVEGVVPRIAGKASICNMCWCWQTSRIFVFISRYLHPGCQLIFTCLFELRYSYIMIIFSFTYNVYTSFTKFIINFMNKHSTFCLLYLFLNKTFNSVTRITTKGISIQNRIISIDSEINIIQT